MNPAHKRRRDRLALKGKTFGKRLAVKLGLAASARRQALNTLVMS